MKDTITYTDEYFLRNLKGVDNVKEALYILMSYRKHVFLDSSIAYEVVLEGHSDSERMEIINKKIFNYNSMMTDGSYTVTHEFIKDIPLEFMKGNSSLVSHFFNLVGFCSLDIIPYIFQAINYHIINSNKYEKKYT